MSRSSKADHPSFQNKSLLNHTHVDVQHLASASSRFQGAWAIGAGDESNPMHTLEGTDSEYDKKAILAALHHLSRCLGPSPDRPPEVKQGIR